MAKKPLSDLKRLADGLQSMLAGASMGISAGLDHAEKLMKIPQAASDPRTAVAVACRAIAIFCKKKGVKKGFAVAQLEKAFGGDDA
jgi:hypothetical protein